MSLARHMAVMRTTAFLRVLDDDALKLLAFGSEPQAVKPRGTVFEAGEPAAGALLVLGGQLRLIPPHDAAPPRTAGVGTLIDELALIIETRRTGSAVAQTSCEVLHIPRTQMLRILDEYPKDARYLRGILAARATAFIADVEQVSLNFFRRDRT